jgi:hypothetical protein
MTALSVIPVAKSFVRLHVAKFLDSGGSRNPGRTDSRLYLGQCVDPGFRRGDEWQHAIAFDKHYGIIMAIRPAQEYEFQNWFLYLKFLKSALQSGNEILSDLK